MVGGGDGGEVDGRTRAKHPHRPCVIVTRKRRRARLPVPRSLRRAMSALLSLARRSRVATRRARRVRRPVTRLRAVREPERGGIAAAAGTRRVSSSDPDRPPTRLALREGACARPSRVPRSDLSVRADSTKRSSRPGRGGAFRARPRHQEGTSRRCTARSSAAASPTSRKHRTFPRDAALADNFVVCTSEVIDTKVTADGTGAKLVVRLHDGRLVETVVIGHARRDPRRPPSPPDATPCASRPKSGARWDAPLRDGHDGPREPHRGRDCRTGVARADWSALRRGNVARWHGRTPR